MRLALLALALISSVAACGSDDAPPASPLFEGDVMVDSSGFSEPLAFGVPDDARSITIVATGAADALYALGSFETADGTERVGIDLATAPGTTMRASYDTEQIGHMPGMLYQSIRLGTFTHVYPYRPDQSVVPGTASLRIASDRPGPVHVTILIPPDDGGKTLHLNLFAISETLTLPQPPTFLDEVQTLLGQAQLTVVVDEIRALRGTGLSSITESTEPQEAPPSQSARITGVVDAPASPSALDVFIVDSLPSGIAGLSLGTPGPPLRGSYYYGVLVERTANDASIGFTIAHELAHFLALQHVTNTGVSGMTYPDPLDDTVPGQPNMMQSGTGTTLTADQAFALSRSALLSLD